MKTTVNTAESIIREALANVNLKVTKRTHKRTGEDRLYISQFSQSGYNGDSQKVWINLSNSDARKRIGNKTMLILQLHIESEIWEYTGMFGGHVGRKPENEQKLIEKVRTMIFDNSNHDVF
jgi:hypothetical protein